MRSQPMISRFHTSVCPFLLELDPEAIWSKCEMSKLGSESQKMKIYSLEDQVKEPSIPKFSILEIVKVVKVIHDPEDRVKQVVEPLSKFSLPSALDFCPSKNC